MSRINLRDYVLDVYEALNDLLALGLVDDLVVTNAYKSREHLCVVEAYVQVLGYKYPVYIIEFHEFPVHDQLFFKLRKVIHGVEHALPQETMYEVLLALNLERI